MRKASSDYLPVLRFSVLAPFYDPLVALTTRERTETGMTRKLSSHIFPRRRAYLSDNAALRPASTVSITSVGSVPIRRDNFVRSSVVT